MTHQTLHRYIFMEGEVPEDTLDLAGLENAPGVYDEVTQCCRLVFTNKKRLVFTQVLIALRVCVFPSTELEGCSHRACVEGFVDGGYLPRSEIWLRFRERRSICSCFSCVKKWLQQRYQKYEHNPIGGFSLP